MKSIIESIISNGQITTVFQPIFNIEDETILGYEALSRGPENCIFYSPEALFKAAEKYDLLSDLELLCREKAINRFIELALSGKLFLNISVNAILNKAHPHGETIKLARKFGLSPSQVVLEISEKNPFPNNDTLIRALDKYRNFGFEVAIDDLGAGYSGLKQWSSLRPDIVKIDRYFVERCDQDIMKREFLKILFELGRISNAQVIVEGIETQAEFELLRELGMVFAQGYFLARPIEYPTSSYPELKVNAKVEYDYRQGTIALLAEKTITINSTQTADDAYRIFSRHDTKHNTRIDAIPVLEDMKPIGMVYRNELMELYSDIYGRALTAKRTAREIMSAKVMIFEHSMPLEQVSKLLTERENSEFTQASIITESGHYLGIVSPRDLLKSITDSKLEKARYANPLTGLPGNVQIEKEIDNMLAKQQRFYLAYLDLNHFKPFNDIYGYANGDLLLKTLANCVMANTINKQCFVGHIGGDDFIVVFKADNFEPVCNNILNEFAKQSLSFISEEDQRRKGYYGINRSGDEVFNPLVSLAIGVITIDNFSPKLENNSYHHIADLASKAKHEAKKLTGNSLFICRRKHTDGNFTYSDITPDSAA